MKENKVNPEPMRNEESIIQWGIDRNLIGETGEATKLGQYRKTHEEVGEILEAIELNDIDKARDAIGDTYVTLVLQAQMWGLTMAECVDQAWLEIKDRKGRMVNGVFVKEGDGVEGCVDEAFINKAGEDIYWEKIKGKSTQELADHYKKSKLFINMVFEHVLLKRLESVRADRVHGICFNSCRGLTTRSTNGLLSADVKTDSQLIRFYQEKGKRGLWRLPGVGRASMLEIVAYVKDLLAGDYNYG